MNTARVGEVLEDIREIAKAPRRVPLSVSAAENVRIAGTGGYTGPWDPTVTPYMVEPMDLLASRQYEAVIFVSPARAGKTQSLVDCWIAHAVICDPGDMAIILPTQDSAYDYRRRRVERMHRHSPALRERMSSRAHDTTMNVIVYRHGMMLNLGWPTSSQLAQRDLRYIGLSDYDSMPDDVGGEGEPFALARKRTQTFLSAGKTLVESSPKRPRLNPRWTPATPHEAPPTDGGALSLYNRGDRRRYYWQCLACRAWWEAPALPRYDDLPDPMAASETAHVACPHCGAIYRQDAKRRLNTVNGWVPEGCTRDAEGRLHGTPRRSSIASFWLLGCAAAFQGWSSLVLNHLMATRELEATGNEEALRTTTNVDQGMPYLPRAMAASRSADALAQRGQIWDRGEVPHGVRFLVAAADVQARRFVVQVLGFGLGETWLIDRYEIVAAPGREGAAVDPAARPEDWLALTEVIGSSYALADGSNRRLPLRLLACDSGGKAGVTERAYGWWRGLRGSGLAHRVRLVKGDAAARPTGPRVVESYPDSQRKDRHAGARGDVPVLMLNTLVLKDALDADLKRAEPGPGYVHFPEWAPREVFEELTAEIRGPKGWERPGSAPNEAWDLMIYARAAASWLGMDRWGPEWENAPAWADAWDENPDVIQADGTLIEENTPLLRRNNYVMGWRPR